MRKHPAVPHEVRQVAQPPWEYLPVEPIAVLANYTHDNTVIDRRSFDKISDALAHFARFHLGPIEGRAVALVDAEMQMIVAYSCEPNEGCHWTGTRIGFELLELFHDRGSVILWAASSVHGDMDQPLQEPSL